MPRPRLRKRWILHAMFWLALAILAAVGTGAVLSVRRATNSFDWVEHTYRVIASLQEYRALLRATESSARGYRLTRSPALRDEFFTTSQAIDHKLTELGTLVSDTPTQASRVRQLGQLTNRRLEISRTLIEESHRGSDRTQVFAAGVVMSGRIEQTIAAMLQTERALLVQRRGRIDRQARLLVLFNLVGTGLSLLLLLFLTGGLQREVRRSHRLERQTRDAASGLEHSLAELAHVSEQRGALTRYASLLQSCQSVEEALKVTGHVVAELVPGTGGRCYLLRASQDLAETAIVFGTPAAPSAELLQPAQCWGLRRGSTFTVDNLPEGVSCAHVEAAAAAPGSWTLCVPLLAQGIALGLLHVSGPPRHDHHQVRVILESVAEQLRLALVNLQLRETLRMQSLRDPLTGLFNRRYLDESLQREVMRCERRGLPLAVLMVDVDHFKAFNDRNGHAAGDALLAAIGHALQRSARNEDLVCRYGGEEFTVVMVETDPADAIRRAEEIRMEVGATTVQHLKRMLGPCTVSIGLATLPGDATTPAELLEKADAALYRAKTAGRDRVVTSMQVPG